MVAVRFLQFSLYYVSLLVRVKLGIYNNLHTLNVKWRWRNWNFRAQTGPRRIIGRW